MLLGEAYEYEVIRTGPFRVHISLNHHWFVEWSSLAVPMIVMITLQASKLGTDWQGLGLAHCHCTKQ